jgi:hypothetical protein
MNYVVPSGESVVFILMNSEGSKKTMTLKCEPGESGNG